MAFQLFLFLLVVFLLLSLARLGRLDGFPLRSSSSHGRAKRTTFHRLLKPRSPDDCPACRLASTPLSAGGPAPVRPWREGKSRRGAPKRIPTEGFACPNPQCRYCGITDAHMHALVGDGKHGQSERIQTFRCQACRTTFTARRDTPLYRLKTPSQQVGMVLSALAEGLDPSAAERVFGYRQSTITSLSDPCWTARTDPARALLPPSLAPTPPTGRTAHPAALRHTGAVALVGHRSSHQDSSGAPSGSTHAELGTSRHPFPARALGPWMPAAVHQ